MSFKVTCNDTRLMHLLALSNSQNIFLLTPHSRMHPCLSVPDPVSGMCPAALTAQGIQPAEDINCV